MKRICLLAAAAGASIAISWTAPASAQTSGVRGVVTDEQGQPIPEVTIEIQYQGAGPKRAYTQKTNKKGGFVRIGMPDGSYKIILSKEGYQTYGIEKYLGLGEIFELCGNLRVGNDPCNDLVLKKAKVVTTIQGAPGTTGGAPKDEAAAKAAAEEAAKLGATYQAAVEAIKAQQWDAAETALKEVLAKVPDQPVVLFNLGHVYRQKKDFAGAETEFKRAIELEPTKADSYIALASMYEEQGKSAEAVDLLAKASPGFEQDAKFQTALGATAMNAGREKEAEEAFTRVATLDLADVEVQYYLASLALNRNEVDDAIAHLEKYLAEAPPTSANVQVAQALLTTLKAKQKKK